MRTTVIVVGSLAILGIMLMSFKGKKPQTVLAGIEVKDASGNVIGTTNALGQVINSAGEIVATVAPDGKVTTVTGTVVAQIEPLTGTPAIPDGVPPLGGTEEDAARAAAIEKAKASTAALEKENLKKTLQQTGGRIGAARVGMDGWRS